MDTSNMFGLRKKLLPVQTVGSKVLKSLAAPIPAVTPELQDLAEKMIDTMFAFDGIGLAGPQVGVSQRIVTLGFPTQLPRDEISPGEALLLPKMPIVLINPQIISYSSDTYVQDEGCLSVPEIYAPVERPSTIVFQSEILNHGTVTIECGGLLARCIQHELDHLDGKLFIDRVKPGPYAKIEKQVKELIARGRKNNFTKLRP